MKIINSGPQTGKTTKLIRLAEKNNGYIVCRTRQESARIMKHAKALDVSIHHPMSYQEFINKHFLGKDDKKIYIDELESLLNYIAPGLEIGAITMDGELND